MFHVLLIIFAFGRLNYILELTVVTAMLVYLLHKRNYCAILPRGGEFWTLMVASISYFVLYFYHFSAVFTARTVIPILIAFIAYIRGSEGIATARKDVLFIAVSLFVHGLLNILTNLRIDIFGVGGRVYNDILGQRINVTLQNLFFTITCSLFFYFLAYEKNLFKVLGCCMAVVGTVGSILSASRTILYLTVICLFISYVTYFILEHKINRKFIVRTAGILCFCAIAVILYNLDAFGVKSWFLNSPLARREDLIRGSEFANDGRWTMAKDSYGLIMGNFWGNVHYNHYAHNLWLDIGLEVGMIPLLLYVLHSLFVFFDGVKFIKCPYIASKDKMLLAMPTIAIFITFFTEPIMQGAPYMFSIFCYMAGMMKALTRRKPYHLNG